MSGEARNTAILTEAYRRWSDTAQVAMAMA